MAKPAPNLAQKSGGRESRAAGNATRDRVLAVALDLFNAHGPDRVTTADIAAAAAINEGNLYYWFARKAQIVEAIFVQFEQSMLDVAHRELGAPNLRESYDTYQRGWFGLTREYRFFYRDGMALRVMVPDLKGRINALNTRAQSEVRRVFDVMRSNGLMRATDDDLAALIANLWIVSGYWMDFYALRHDGAVIEAEALAWGARQVESLVRPYLV